MSTSQAALANRTHLPHHMRSWSRAVVLPVSDFDHLSADDLPGGDSARQAALETAFADGDYVKPLRFEVASGTHIITNARNADVLRAARATTGQDHVLAQDATAAIDRGLEALRGRT